jgi:GT2 family glycosyltransferase/glycosyltransferase involved in cell wall biosynthesis
MKKSMMIVTEAFELGGVETYIRTEVEQLNKQGWHVHLVCGRRFSEVMLPHGLASKTSGLALGPEATIEEFLRSVDQIVDIARRENVSVINAHPFTSLISSVAAASLLKIPCVATLHGPSSIAGSYGPAFDFMLASLILPAVSRVSAVSDEVAALARPYTDPARLSILVNAITPPLPVLPGIMTRSGRWLVVSRLDQAKSSGIIDFARTATEIGLAGVDICGDGPHRSYVENSLSDLIDCGDVQLLGAHADAAALMPSYAGVAGMGRVVIEALAAGLPVVLVGYDGIKGLVDSNLYLAASWANFSGRGLATISSKELDQQIHQIDARATAVLRDQVLAQRDASALWKDFAVDAINMAPVHSEIIDTYLQLLRVMHPRSQESALWSREVMNTLARVVASPMTTGTPLVEAFNIHSQIYSRALTDQLSEIAARMATDQRHDASRIFEALHADSIMLFDSMRERISAESEAMQRHHAEANQRAREELWADFEALHGAARSESYAQHEEIRMEFEALRNAAKNESQTQIEIVKHELSTLHDALREQVVTEAEDLKRDTLLSYSQATKEIEIKVERAIEVMESTIRQDIARIAGGLNAQEEAKRDIVKLHQQVLRLEQELVEIYGSTSWNLTRPLRVLKRLVLEPRMTLRLIRSRRAESQPSEQDHAAAASGQSSSRIRQAWNFIRRSLRTGSIDPADKARLIAVLRSNYATASVKLGVEVKRPALARADDGLEDVFVWSVIDWHFRMQRPQHLAAALARKGHRVFYISNNFVDSANPGFSVEALDSVGRLFQVNLNVRGAPQIYFDVASSEQVAEIQASLADLLKWAATTRSMSLVQHPFWIEPAQSLPNMRLVYDCMDHHGGFENNAANVLAGERILLDVADLLIVTSQWLYDEMVGKSANIVMIRNATEYEHFCESPANVFADSERRRVIGYYGAIAEWFDVDLIRQTALDHPQDLVLLVGRDTAGAEQSLAGLPNVRFIGEVPYSELPYWVHGFDVCLLPFRVIPLTLATNPVKVYEYLSAGKPTVSVDLPEMAQFEGLVHLATDPHVFSREVSRALQPEMMDAAQVHARQAFSRKQTWFHRAAELERALETISEPKVSVIVLCFNNLEFTRACLDSLELYSDYPNLEIIAVDNASSDGTPVFLQKWQAGGTNRRFICNDTNLGFSAGNNVGLRAATGDYLVVLNNDTYVTPGWVRGMVRHLKRNPKVGLVGPVTNNIGNEARIEIQYTSMEQMIERAGEYTRRHPGHAFPIRVAAFFCVMMTRQAYEAVGPMDEDFGVGFFEDDDYCRRLALCGFQVCCADDVFIHHHLSASFNKLKAEEKQVLFERNKKIYEAKWGPWLPHVYRERAMH